MMVETRSLFMQDGSVIRGRGLAIAVAVIVGATTVLYVWLIVEQGDVEVGQFALVLLLFLAAFASVIGALKFDSADARGVSGFGAAGILLSMGYLALFSVGLPLLVAGMLMVVWLVRTRNQRLGDGRLTSVSAFIIGAVLPWTLVLD
jgi:hypothetical protein